MKNLLAIGVIAGLTSCITIDQTDHSDDVNLASGSQTMELGTFSISLAVADLSASRTFYEQLGFTVIGGEAAQNWLILQNGDATIGLFHGMFEKNIMTFNPGWSRTGDHPDEYTDIREIQQRIKQQGLTLTSEADESTTGPASLMLVDPDGNTILIDQHR